MILQSPVDKKVVTTVGYTFVFKANEPIEVPIMAVQACLQAGCHVVKGDITPAEVKIVQALQGPERDRVIGETMKKLVARNDRNDFTGSGKPNATVLTEMLGFTIFAAERDRIWQDVSESIGEAS